MEVPATWGRRRTTGPDMTRRELSKSRRGHRRRFGGRTTDAWVHTAGGCASRRPALPLLTSCCASTEPNIGSRSIRAPRCSMPCASTCI